MQYLIRSLVTRKKMQLIPFFVRGDRNRQFKAPDNKVHWANMGPTWVLSAPDGPHEAWNHNSLHKKALSWLPLPSCRIKPKQITNGITYPCSNTSHCEFSSLLIVINLANMVIAEWKTIGTNISLNMTSVAMAFSCNINRIVLFHIINLYCFEVFID